MGLKLAVIPWIEGCLQDKMFITEDNNVNFDCRNDPFVKMKNTFEKNGDSFHTIDLYENLNEVDYFLFFDLDWKWLDVVIRAGGESKMIYCNGEPPVVYPINSPEGYKFLGKFFPYILTWNDDWIDGKQIFKRTVPYYFREEFGNVKFEEKKLLTSISGNKKSDHPDELYSEREKAVTFFETYYPEDFDFYGTGWEEGVHSSYRGRADKKSETYHKYKFAICFENMKNINGYVTEKLFDCLTSGVVPVYWGAENIDSYVPKECFVDYRKFSSLEELANYLFNVTEEEYQEYLFSAKKFLHSDMPKRFSGEEYARNIYEVTKLKKQFKISLINKFYVKFILCKLWISKNIKQRLKKIVLRNKE